MSNKQNNLDEQIKGLQKLSKQDLYLDEQIKNQQKLAKKDLYLTGFMYTCAVLMMATVALHVTQQTKGFFPFLICGLGFVDGAFADYHRQQYLHKQAMIKKMKKARGR